jgi:Zn-dependent protease with chaperone function
MEPPSIAFALRAFVAVLLVAGFYVVGIGLIVVLGWLSAWMLFLVPGKEALVLSGVFVASAVALAVPLWRSVLTRSEPPALGVPVTEQQAPELWSLVRELAKAVETRPPDEIRLFHEANAAVWEETRLTGLRVGRRCLYLGVPLLNAYSVAQVRAVLAHELGHYSLRHTPLAAVVYRGGVAMIHTIIQAGPRSPFGMVLSGYAALYFLVALSVMRRTELAADRAAVRVAGRKATASAIRLLPDLAADWEVCLSRYADRARYQGAGPAEILSSFVSFVADPGEREWFRQRLAPPPQWDTHPPTSARLVAIRGEPEPPVVADERPGRVLVADPEAMPAVLRTEEFDRHAERLVQLQAERWAENLHHAAASVLSRRWAYLGDVLDLLADGRAADLGSALRIPAEDGDRLVDFVVVAASAVLVDTGRAHWRHAVGEPLALVAGDDDPVALRHPVSLACFDPGHVAEVRRLLRNLGVTQEWYLTGRVGDAAGPPLDPGLGPGLELLLPDQLFLLTGWSVNSGTRDAALAASVLAELRLRERIALTPTKEATVIVRDATSTGDGLLDSVLARLSDGPLLPAYRWVETLGRDVARTVPHRIRQYDGPLDLREQARTGVLRAVSEGDRESREMALGSLLWGAEVAGSVLGWRALVGRFWLGRIAARDPLAVAIRIVVGPHFRPLAGGGGGAGG